MHRFAAPIGALLLSLALVPAVSAQDVPADAASPFTLPALPYAEDALSPVIDADTMALHHGRHHKGYVDNLNARVAQLPDLAATDLETLLGQVSRHDAAIRNNAGGHYNHSLFWRLMAPAGHGGTPSPELLARIARDFGAYDAFVQRFETAARGIFGSGWAWLVLAADGTLSITTTANQDNPLMDVVEHRGTPLLALDVWEHAYYLQYRNRRADYVSGWWTVVNWNEVNRRYADGNRRHDTTNPASQRPHTADLPEREVRAVAPAKFRPGSMPGRTMQSATHRAPAPPGRH
jgi:superoxide dismutase, Fe-Mn family